MTRGAARAVAVAAFVAALAGSGVPLASAAGPAPPAPTVPPDVPSRLALVSQDAWTVLGGTIHACLQIAELGPGEQLLVAVHQSVPTRSSFDSQQSGPVLTQVVLPVDSLPTSTAGCRSVAIPLSAAAGAFAGQLAVPGAGVYPLDIELRDNQEVGLARFVSYLVAVGAGPGGQPVPLTNRLGVAWVWPLATRPGLNPDASIRATTAAAVDPAGTLGRQVAELAAHPTVPVTLAPAPETLDSWSTLARTDPGAALGAGTLRAAQQAGPDQVIGT